MVKCLYTHLNKSDHMCVFCMYMMKRKCRLLSITFATLQDIQPHRYEPVAPPCHLPPGTNMQPTTCSLLQAAPPSKPVDRINRVIANQCIHNSNEVLDVNVVDGPPTSGHEQCPTAHDGPVVGYHRGQDPSQRLGGGVGIGCFTTSPVVPICDGKPQTHMRQGIQNCLQICM